MRCPSCGTENAPDSRFCGGCGARLEPARVAPTVRLPDDTPYPPPGGRLPTPVPGAVRLPTPPPGALNIGSLPTPVPGSLSYPPIPRAGSIPPANNPASLPPTGNAANTSPGTVHGRAGTPPPALSSPSMSMLPPRRNTAVVAILLVVDLGLAAAGTALLVKGLAKPQAAATPPPPIAELHGEAAAPAPAPVATAPAAAMPAPPPVPTKVAERKPHKRPASAARERDTEPAKATRHAVPQSGGKPGGPLDPYAGAAPPAPAGDQSQDVERMAAQSFGSFRSCLTTAMQGGPIRGAIRIAFVIQPDGHVAHAHAIVNATGSDVLAHCLGQTIANWTFAPHAGPAASYERPFSYP